MLDERTLRRKVFLRLLGSPLTLAPFVLGMTALTATWALDRLAGLGMFAGLAGLLTSAGVFVTRLIASGERRAREILAELDQAEHAARQRALDALDQHLASADTDPRPETALRDLRALLKSFDEQAAAAGALAHGATIIDVQSRVTQLFERCVESLRQTDRLWQTAQRLQTPAARKPLLDQRERVLADVQASVKQLSNTLVALQTLGQSESSPAQLGRLRAELDESLAVAKTVEERVNDLVKEAVTATHEPPLQQKPLT